MRYTLLLTLHFDITIEYWEEFHNTSELKKKFCEEKGIFQSVSPLTRSAERTMSIISQQKMSILIISGRNWICRRRKKENERKDTRYNETKRRHDWKSVASGGPL